MKNYLFANILIKILIGILMSIWFISKYLSNSISGYESIPVIVTAMLFLDLFILETFNLPKILKKTEKRFFLYGESIYKYNNTGDERFCIELNLDEFVKKLSTEKISEVRLTDKEYDYYIINLDKYYILKLVYVKSKVGLKSFFRDINYHEIKQPDFEFQITKKLKR